jgi:catechol 2,3-dioxygenase-like lactoylglutathione lyase family enzyme
MIGNLAYIGFRSPRADAWATFGPEVLGTQLAPDGPDVQCASGWTTPPGASPSTPARPRTSHTLGWKVDDLTATIAAIEAAGIAVEQADVVAFHDPFGFRHELVEAVEPAGPFTPGRPMSGSVTGDQGLGHAVLIVPDLDAAERFYVDVLGFRASDTIEMGITVRFLHCTGQAARHHSPAMSAVPGMVGLHHLMLEVATIDDDGYSSRVAVHERSVRWWVSDRHG